MMVNAYTSQEKRGREKHILLKNWLSWNILICSYTISYALTSGGYGNEFFLSMEQVSPV